MKQGSASGVCYIPKTLHKHLQSQPKARKSFFCFLRKLLKKRSILSFVTTRNPFSTDVKAFLFLFGLQVQYSVNKFFLSSISSQSWINLRSMADTRDPRDVAVQHLWNSAADPKVREKLRLQSIACTISKKLGWRDPDLSISLLQVFIIYIFIIDYYCM